MRDESKTRLYGAAAALSTSVLIGLYQTGRLWSGQFSHQVLSTVVVLSWLPFLILTDALTRVPKFVLIPVALAWLGLASLPVFYHFVLDLFTGHQRPGSQWYDALWRIYAILGLWIGFAVLNERVLRPWWRANSWRVFGEGRADSVAAQAQRLNMDERAKTLEAIKLRMGVAVKKRKLAQRTFDTKRRDVAEARANAVKMRGLADKARARADKAQPEQKKGAEEQVVAVQAMVDTAERQVEALGQDLARLDIEKDEIEVRIQMLQQEWTEALHVDNYSTFYR